MNEDAEGQRLRRAIRLSDSINFTVCNLAPLEWLNSARWYQIFVILTLRGSRQENHPLLEMRIVHEVARARPYVPIGSTSHLLNAQILRNSYISSQEHKDTYHDLSNKPRSDYKAIILSIAFLVQFDMRVYMSQSCLRFCFCMKSHTKQEVLTCGASRTAHEPSQTCVALLEYCSGIYMNARLLARRQKGSWY
jgi:hypothetical protein